MRAVPCRLALAAFVSLVAGAGAMSAGCADSPLVFAPQPPSPLDVSTPASQVVYACGDTVLNDQLTTGGLPVTTFMPCWDARDESEHGTANAHTAAISPATTVAETSSEKQAAKGVVESEIAACAHIPMRERDHSPFSHRRSISEVLPHFENGQLRGVRVVFKPVGALSADWMRQDIACHQAHVAVLGTIPDALAQDPTLVQNAEVTVDDHGGHLTVLVRSDSPDQAALALAKAQGRGPVATMAVRP